MKYSNTKEFIKDWKSKTHERYQGGLDFLKYVGPGLIVTVGFIDPGNWATNFAAGGQFGYSLLWVITLSTIVMIVLQHNAAHLGIVSGRCLSEAANEYFPKKVSRPLLLSAVAASISTSLAEILGGAIALKMLFQIPLKIGAAAVALFAAFLLLTNSYKYIEKIIISLVSLIGLGFLYEVFIIDVDWEQAAYHFVTPSIPDGSLFIVLGVLGAVVMPHNLFLHSEVIQSRQINRKGEKEIEKNLKYEFYDTLLAMGMGLAINSAMIILAATAFHANGINITSLDQAATMLTPLLGRVAGIVFGVALLLAGISSTVTSGMAGGSIFSGIYDEAYNVNDIHSRVGVLISLSVALVIIFFIGDPFKGLLWSQTVLSMQLPLTIFALVYLTSSEKVMGKYKNSTLTKFLLYFIGVIISTLNIGLLFFN